ncbi:hypothetical protein MKW98_031881 [Papaver atlanticum]|uniref:DOG1 domain-containing protein n=1 Tax=Papaver atlanticum TaxID=357466 RepID=A0AAD4XE89_9MAGN|nr:hypothetical protein MKW98_031881 [Papaver atlanticum]
MVVVEAIDDAPCLFSPTWCTSIENSYFWLGGCKPSLMIRLVYSLCGSQLESQLTEFLQGVRKGNIGELSASQLSLVSELQCITVREEDKLSKKMASLQGNIADYPLTRLANNSSAVSDTESHFEQVDHALDSHSKELARILVDLDKLRMITLKELIGILTPFQAVDFLIVGKKLHLCMHRGQRRDHHHGRT